MTDILENDFGIVGVDKRWFRSFLDERQQRVKIKQHTCTSDCFQLNSGVPQVSCLGPLFLMYAPGLFKVDDKHLTNIHTYADDTQLCVIQAYLTSKCS